MFTEKENNQVVISGEVYKEPVFSHKIHGEDFYSFVLKVKRLSEQYDFVTITVSERLNLSSIIEGGFYNIYGQYRSYNNYSGSGNKLILTVFARDVIQLEENDSKLNQENTNSIFLDGYLCKAPIYRKTPFGREIADLLIAVNRAYDKSDYIPAICWGRNARYCENLPVGTSIKVCGRIQSREYKKRISETDYEQKIAFEVSLNTIEIGNQDEKSK